MKVKYGQNFLNKKFAYIFADVVNRYIPSRSVIVEIGAGKGIITHILNQLHNIVCYEIDVSFYKYLHRDIVIWKCFLKNDIQTRYFIGNLPFYCSKDIVLNIVLKKSFRIGVFIVGDYFLKKHCNIFQFKNLEIIRHTKLPGSSFYPICKFNAEIIVIRRNC